MLRFLRHLLIDRGGIAAIEFALIVPTMMVVLGGIIEISYLLMAQRRVASAAHTASDLIAQGTDLTSTDLDDILTASRLIMDQFDDAGLTIGVSSVRYNDSTGAPYEDWSYAYNGGDVTDPTTTATDLGDAGESVIIVNVTYSYTPLLGAVLTSSYGMAETAVAKPRYLDYVGYY